MRIGIFSDIHGNSIGLDTVLTDIEAKGGVDHYWVLGDHIASGPDPIGVLERLIALPNAEFIRGNTDRYIFTDARPHPHAEDVAADISLLPIYGEIQGNFAWTTGIIAEYGYLNWLRNLPFDISKTVPNGVKMWGIHSSPWRDDDSVGFCPDLTDKQIEAYAAETDSDLIFCGHTHWPWRVRVGEQEIINVGSIGQPRTKSMGACWTLLEANDDGYTIQQFEVPFDLQAVIDSVIAKRQPGAKYINSSYENTRLYPWEAEDRK
ncbi:MAG: metallophosphoesterase family protein [Chloroflexota bacterium]